MKNYTLSILGIISGLFVLLFAFSFGWLTWETIDVFVTGNTVNKWPALLFIISNMGVLISSQLWQREKNKLVKRQMEENTKAYQQKFREALRASMENISKAQQEIRDEVGEKPDDYNPRSYQAPKQGFDPDGLL